MILGFRRKALGWHPQGGGGGGGGGGGSTSSTNTSYNVSLQPELMPYGIDIAKQAQNLSGAQYTPYQGQRIADFNPAQQQTQAETMNMQTPQQFGQASQATRMAGLGSMQAGQNYYGMATDPNAVGAFMSPYMQNVVDVQKQQAIRDFSRQQPYQNAQAVGQGAFGGNRMAIQQAMGREALDRQLANIQAAGSQNAFQNAQQAQQFGSTLGLQGLQQAGAMAGQLGSLGGQQQQADLARLGAQGAVGQQQQQLQQQAYSQQYQDFLKQQEYPYSQLAFYNSMIRGLSPTMPTTTQTYTAQPSGLQQLMGLGLGAAGAYKMFAAKGGEVKKMAGGGAVGESPEAQYQRAKFASMAELKASASGQGPFSPDIAMMAMQFQQQYRTAANGVSAGQQAHQPTVRERILAQSGGSPYDRPEMHVGIGTPAVDPAEGMADGGIVGFDGGGEVWRRGREAREAWQDPNHWSKSDPDVVWNPYSEAPRAVGNAVTDYYKTVAGGVADAYNALDKKKMQLLTGDWPEGDLPGTKRWSDKPAPSGGKIMLPEPTPVDRDKLRAAVADAPSPKPAAAKNAPTGKGGGKAKNSQVASVPYELTGDPMSGASRATADPTAGITAGMDISDLKKMAEGIGSLTSPESEAMKKAYEDRTARVKGEADKRRDQAIGQALLGAGAGLMSAPGARGFGAAMQAVGEAGSKYHTSEQQIADKLDELDLQSKQAMLQLKRGDVENGMKLLEHATTQKLKLAELKIDSDFKRGKIGVEEREAAIKAAHLEILKPLFQAQAAQAYAHAGYFGAMGAAAKSGKPLTDAQFASAVNAARDDATKWFTQNPLWKSNPAYKGMTQDEVFEQNFRRYLNDATTRTGVPASGIASLGNPAFTNTPPPGALRQGVLGAR